MDHDGRTGPSEQLLQRIRSEFIEMPGLRLTPDQARRLWNLDRDSCEAVLQTLIDRRFLLVAADGKYLRRSVDIRETRLRMASSTGSAGVYRRRSA